MEALPPSPYGEPAYTIEGPCNPAARAAGVRDGPRTVAGNCRPGSPAGASPPAVRGRLRPAAGELSGRGARRHPADGAAGPLGLAGGAGGGAGGGAAFGG